MPILKLTLVLFFFQIVIFLCISGFNDEVSLSAALTQFWSNFISGSLNKTYLVEISADLKLDIWIYLFLSIFRCICNFTAASKKIRQRTDGVQIFQFLLGSTLSCYLFFLDLWLSTNKGFESCFVILPILSFVSMEVDFSLLASWIGFGAAYFFQIICAIGSVLIFFSNHGCYWLFVPYIIIPAFDIIKAFCQPDWTKCDPSVYLEHLLPSFFLIAYVKPLSGTYMLLYPPETKVVDTCGVFLALGLLLVGSGHLFHQIHLHNRKIKHHFVVDKSFQDEACSICLERLVAKDCLKTSSKKRNYSCCPIKDILDALWNYRKSKLKSKKMKILKTPCEHFFHQNCLEKWLNNKPECPYCRKDLRHFI